MWFSTSWEQDWAKLLSTRSSRCPQPSVKAADPSKFLQLVLSCNGEYSVKQFQDQHPVQHQNWMVCCDTSRPSKEFMRIRRQLLWLSVTWLQLAIFCDGKLDLEHRPHIPLFSIQFCLEPPPPAVLESYCLHFWLQISSPSIPWLPSSSVTLWFSLQSLFGNSVIISSQCVSQPTPFPSFNLFHYWFLIIFCP